VQALKAHVRNGRVMQNITFGATAAALACVAGCTSKPSLAPPLGAAGSSSGAGGAFGDADALDGASDVDLDRTSDLDALVDAGPPPDDSAPWPDRTAPVGFVHADGARLLDGSGNPLLLRTAALGNWLLNEGYMWRFRGTGGDRARRIERRIVELIGEADAAAFWQSFRDGYITEADFVRISSLGFNSVRLAMNARLLMPEGQSAFDENEFRHLQDVVDWGTRQGVYVIFDMHGAPGGQTGTNIDDDADDRPALFTDLTNQDRLVALWGEIARRFADRTIVLGYDLLNEPLPGTTPNFLPLYRTQLWPLYQRVSRAIRAVDPNHVLIVEGGNWANDWTTLGPPYDANMMYSFHKYCFSCSAADLAASETVSSIQTYLAYRTAWSRPIWCGEAGENTNAWYSAVYRLFEDNNVGWTFWTWKKTQSTNNPYAITPPPGWATIQAYVQASAVDAGPAPLPPAAEAKATLDQFLVNIRLDQNTFNQAVLCSLPAAISSNAGCPTGGD
jgi:Cellulase (glycosyl hydrolase family 5)